MHVQDIVKERFFSEKKPKEIYKETINNENNEDYGRPLEETKVGDNGNRTTTGKKFKGLKGKVHGETYFLCSQAHGLV
ncbi:hypothetical protein bcere0029_28760 [Bacillus cereus AH1272]|nr:hypothetical protein bcere0029_28760 [Bacillus cereus AH1272]